MLARGLYPACRNDPCPERDIDLAPLRAKHFADTCGRQDQKLQGQRMGRFALAQRGDEGRNFGIVHCRVMTAGKLLPFG